jgi:hypothetical protein
MSANGVRGPSEGARARRDPGRHRIAILRLRLFDIKLVLSRALT